MEPTSAPRVEAKTSAAEPFYLTTEQGDRFCLYHPPARDTACFQNVVYVHPFAEEMNKSRRMAALQARRLAAAGCGVLQIDLKGCGDSSGEFLDARWESWKSDVAAGIRWIRRRNEGRVTLWGLRLGGLLAAEIAHDDSLDIHQLLLWQPVVTGELFLTQFLRLHLAAQMLSDGAASTDLKNLRAALARGEPLEIGGYELHSELAAAIERSRLGECTPKVKCVHWLEVSALDEPKLTPASMRAVESWRANGVNVRTQAVHGEAFWSTLETTECESLLSATDAALRLSCALDTSMLVNEERR